MRNPFPTSCPDLLAGFAARVVIWRYAVLALAAAATALALLMSVRYLGISTDTVDMIASEVPFRQHAQAFNKAFPQLNNLILAVVDGPTPEAANRAAGDFAGRLRGRESVRDVYMPGGAFIQRHAFLYMKQDRLTDVLDRLASAQPLLAALNEQPDVRGLADLLRQAAERPEAVPGGALKPLLTEMAATARAQANGEPRRVSWQRLFGPQDGNFSRTRRFVLVRPDMNYSRLKPAAAAIADARAAQRAVSQNGPGRVRLTGEAVIEHQELLTVESSGTRAAVLSLVAVAVILLTGLRAPRLVACSLITLVLGLIWTAGIAAAVVGELNLISVAFAVLFLGLGIDFCIHFALHYREESRNGARETIKATARAVGCALVLSAVCAALGFLSFLPTAYRGLAELGLISGIGMAVALTASLTVLPALLAVWQPRRGLGEPSRVIQRERYFVTRHGRTVLVVAAAAGIAGLAIAPSVQFDFNPMNLRDPDNSSIRVFRDLAGDPASTPYTINVLAPDIRAANALAETFRSREGFGRARTVSSYVPDNQDAKLAAIRDAGFYLAPLFAPGTAAEPPGAAARREAMATIGRALDTLAEREGATGEAAKAARRAMRTVDDTGALAERWTAYLPGALTFVRKALQVDRITLDELPRSLRERWVAPGGAARVQVQPARALTTNDDLRRFAQRALDVTPRATGAPVIIHQASNAVVGAFKKATLFAVIAILIVLAVTLRRFVDVLLTLAPLALAAILTLATAALAGITLNFANVIVLPLLLGLGVSSGIHLVLRARRIPHIDEVFATSTPRAVFLSVLTTLGSFGTLIVSDHQGMSSMGSLLTLAVTFILLSVLFVLPCLIAAVAPPSGQTGADRGEHGA